MNPGSGSYRPKVFVSYAHEDEELCEALRKHLAVLEREGKAEFWYDRQVTAGERWEAEIGRHLDSADLVLVLISPDFVASEFCWKVELPRALGRHYRRHSMVIPILLRPVDWGQTQLAQLQALPDGAKPVTLWPSRDEAFLSVGKGLRKAIDQVTRLRQTSVEPPPEKGRLPGEVSPKPPQPPSIPSTLAGMVKAKPRWWMGAAIAALALILWAVAGLLSSPSPRSGFVDKGEIRRFSEDVEGYRGDPRMGSKRRVTQRLALYSNPRHGPATVIGHWEEGRRFTVGESLQGNSETGVWLDCRLID